MVVKLFIINCFCDTLKMVYTISGRIEINKESKGSAWKELLFAFSASLPFFTQGIIADTLTATAQHTGHFSSLDHVPWSTTIYIMAAMISAPIFCSAIERFGRKVGIFIVSLVQGMSCIPLLLDISDVNVIVLHTLAGISSGGLFTVFPTYIREISSIPNRAFALSLMMPMTSGAYMMRLVMDLEELTFLMVALVAGQMMMVFVLVESPSYSVMVGKYERAKLNIARLICLPPEHPTVFNIVANLKDESERAKSVGDLTIVTVLKNPIWRGAIKIGIVLHTVLVLGGSIVFLDQHKTLIQLKLTEDPDRLLTLATLFAGSMLCTMVIRVVERKYLLATAFSLMVLSLGTLGVYTQADLTVTTLRWVPVVALGVLLFWYGVAWGLPIVVTVELFNCEIRAHLTGLLFAYSQLLKLVHVHSFPHIEGYMGIYTLCYIFVAVNLFGAVYSLFHIPDLKNKSTRQIERQLKRVPLLKM